MNSAYTNNLEYARGLQEKYEYYQAGLNFTLLAASIQTAAFDDGKLSTGFELLGWTCLLISGILALLRFRMQPVAHKNVALTQKKKSLLEKYREAKNKGTREVLWSDTGEVVTIDQAIKEAEDSLTNNEPKIKELESRLIQQATWHMWLFVAGFCFVFIARAVSPLVGLFCGQ